MYNEMSYVQWNHVPGTEIWYHVSSKLMKLNIILSFTTYKKYNPDEIVGYPDPNSRARVAFRVHSARTRPEINTTYVKYSLSLYYHSFPSI